MPVGKHTPAKAEANQCENRQDAPVDVEPDAGHNSNSKASPLEDVRIGRFFVLVGSEV